MAPSHDHVIRCSRQTEDLFDIFFSLKDDEIKARKKRESGDEIAEVHHVTQSILVRDNGVPLRSSNDYSNDVISRSPVHTQSYNARHYKPDTHIKRKSLELERERHASPSRSVLDTKMRSSPTPHPLDDFARRPRTQSVGPSDDQLRLAAVKIAEVGDRIEQEYAGRFGQIEHELVDYLLHQGRDLTYEQFAVHVNDLIGEDRNWTNFMFAMHLGRRVAIETHSAGTHAVSFFRRFIGAAFGERIAEEEDIVHFVNQEENKD